MFGTDRNQLRRFYVDSWQKAQAGQALQPLEALVVDIIRAHPEYQALLSGQTEPLDRDYLPEAGETNPFLHMGMHIAIREQVQTDRPAGILGVYQKLTKRLGDAHAADHQLMECLGQALWEAQRSGREPDQQAYLECAKRLL